jgi:4'-phosphopantetheinyl transferase EntD
VIVRVDAPHGCLAIVDGTATPHELGRAALRAALAELGCAIDDAIARDDRGAPVVPAGFVGSIAHKPTRAIALAARAAADGARVGVDIERAVAPRQPIERRVLTERELAVIGAGDRRAVTLRFAIKEAIYKAVDPFVRRYVGFTEVELDVGAPGACAVRVVDPARLPIAIAAWWCERDGYWIATARAVPS